MHFLWFFIIRVNLYFYGGGNRENHHGVMNIDVVKGENYYMDLWAIYGS